MTYYILLEGDSKQSIWDENILGEESFGTFYTGNGFKALNSIVMSESHLVETVTILDEKNQSYSVEEFIKLISKINFFILSVSFLGFFLNFFLKQAQALVLSVFY